MKEIINIACLMFLLTGCIGSGDISTVKDNGEGYFPSMVGINLHGKKKAIPRSFNRKYNIVIVAFERDHQNDVNTWMESIENIVSANDDVGFYEIPLIYAMKPPSRFWLNNAMRAGITDEKSRTRTITVYANKERFKTVSKMETDRIHILLLKKNGEIIFKSEGPFSDKKLKKLQNAVSKRKWW